MKRREHDTTLLRQRAEEVAKGKGLKKQNSQPFRKFKSSLQILEKTFASLRAAVFIIDAKNTRILECNAGASQIFGYRKEEMLGRTTGFLHVDEERLEEFRKRLFPAVEERGCLELPEFQMKRRNGEVFITSHSVTPLEDNQGKRIGWVSVVRDVTERKRAEEALRGAKKGLEIRVKERTAELQQTNERLKQENQERMRTEQSLRLEEARLDALLHLSQISAASLKEISGFTLEQAIGLTQSKIGFVGFLNEDESIYTLHAVSKEVVKECNVTGDPLQWHVVDAGIWADAIRERKTLFVNDYRNPHPRKKGLPPGHPYVERLMVVPILEGERIVAVAGVANKASEYNRSDERQIFLLLKGMWGYVQKNRSREELEKAYSELEEKVKQRTAELSASTQALQEKQKDLTRAQEVGKIGSWRLDVRRNVLTWSDETYRLFAVSSGTPMTYETFLGLVHPDDRRMVDDKWNAALRGEPYDLEHRIVVEGRVKWVREKAYLEFDDGTNLRGGFGITQDITDRKGMEEKLRESRDELEVKVRERTAELVRANRELQEEMAKREKAEQQLRQSQKLEAIGTLAGGIAHDFNNLLAAIIINSEMAFWDLPQASAVRNNLDLILKSGLRGQDLVRQMLLFSRKSEKKQEIITIAPLIKETFKLLRSAIPTTIQMQLHLATESDSVYADPSQIQQVIMNLCTNAAYAMRGTTGSIDISLQAVTFGPTDLPEQDMQPGDYLVLSVKDTGSGMGEEVRKRIFEPFFTTKPVGEGTGLGLSVVYGIVKSHKGNITVYSEPGRGSVFKVYLPKADTRLSEKAEPPKPIPGGNERLLLVDDEEIIVHSVQNLLQHLGYRVTALTDSEEALRLFSENPSQFDLVITDQTMPGMTGEDLGKQIMSIRPDIPVILCTGYADMISSEKAMALGFRGYVWKPFTVREGAELVRSVLNEKEPGDK
jgi:PAS domain S-box-containing protein